MRATVPAQIHHDHHHHHHYVITRCESITVALNATLFTLDYAEGERAYEYAVVIVEYPIVETIPKLLLQLTEHYEARDFLPVPVVWSVSVLHCLLDINNNNSLY